MEPTRLEHHENRRFDREQLYYYLKVYHGQTKKLAGYLANISNDGLMLFSSQKIKSGAVLEFRIDLDKEFGLGDSLLFKLESRWCEKDINPDYYIIGFKFIAIDQAMIDKVQYLIQKYGFEYKFL